MSDASHRYARQLAIKGFGQTRQEQLNGARILLVGLGGLGCPAATYLASAGAGHLYLNDFDTVKESNLHRQTLYSDTDVGKRKTAVAAARLQALNPEARITTIDERLDAAALDAQVAEVDVVLDGTDNFATREAINAACLAHGRPLISGAAIGLDGQIGVYPCDREGPCYQCFLAGIGDNLGDCEGQGILGPITGVIGSLMALEAIKIVTNLGLPLAGRMLLFDGGNAEWKALVVKRRDGCQACA